MLEDLLKVVPFVLQGARNNLYGWGCPLYCSEPSWSGLALTFLLGLFLGISLAILGLWALWSHLHLSSSVPPSESPDHHPPVQSRHSALSEYVDAFQPSRRRKR